MSLVVHSPTAAPKGTNSPKGNTSNADASDAKAGRDGEPSPAPSGVSTRSQTAALQGVKGARFLSGSRRLLTGLPSTFTVGRKEGGGGGGSSRRRGRKPTKGDERRRAGRQDLGEIDELEESEDFEDFEYPEGTPPSRHLNSGGTRRDGLHSGGSRLDDHHSEVQSEHLEGTPPARRLNSGDSRRDGHHSGGSRRDDRHLGEGRRGGFLTGAGGGYPSDDDGNGSEGSDTAATAVGEGPTVLVAEAKAAEGDLAATVGLTATGEVDLAATGGLAATAEGGLVVLGDPETSAEAVALAVMVMEEAAPAALPVVEATGLLLRRAESSIATTSRSGSSTTTRRLFGSWKGLGRTCAPISKASRCRTAPRQPRQTTSAPPSTPSSDIRPVALQRPTRCSTASSHITSSSASGWNPPRRRSPPSTPSAPCSRTCVDI